MTKWSTKVKRRKEVAKEVEEDAEGEEDECQYHAILTASGKTKVREARQRGVEEAPLLAGIDY
eukprot:1511020-Pyramimonas_sp.AAC.1